MLDPNLTEAELFRKLETVLKEMEMTLHFANYFRHCQGLVIGSQLEASRMVSWGFVAVGAPTGLDVPL